MIPYARDPQQTIPSSAVKIIGLGGAGSNMLERIALDGIEDAELLGLNTDARTLSTCLAREKIQLGSSLTRGLGAGGDPGLGQQAVLEAESEIRSSIRGRAIVFLCVGLGGGTGSGAAPMVTRIAREEGAFVVVFATMPFAFEGLRRREQAETALNELAVLANALVTFDNNRMGELVLAKQGIHEAFTAADHMIGEAIKAVLRLVIRPGIINVGLDELMSALRTNRSRCLFGSGIANGKDRAAKALKNALNSPLLDQGALLKTAQTVLVHLAGGSDLTLFEIELLMQRLQKFVPADAQILFGAAIDQGMGDSLSITLISALPEDSLATSQRASLSHQAPESLIPDPIDELPATTPRKPSATLDAVVPEATREAEALPLFSTEPETPKPGKHVASFTFTDDTIASDAMMDEPDHLAMLEDEPESEVFDTSITPLDSVSSPESLLETPVAPVDAEHPKLKLGIKSSGPQAELSLDSLNRGRFEGETPNVFEGEDLDLPPFLRKKK